jgi:hypothetical protein
MGPAIKKNQWDTNGIHWYIDVYRKFRNKMNKSYKLLKPQEWEIATTWCLNFSKNGKYLKCMAVLIG